ncbi:hypothetical protein LPJ66_000639 [Kickxella alabastrina]|uniref:Uncharacterized protein n=1 Tax=Kickxella alabastrina TaxID=61397 RepID=A0ACC1IVG2_9FUNG|nr:hypothetical protein LPJ66_000639 [Kickxella alabastrina]
MCYSKARSVNRYPVYNFDAKSATNSSLFSQADRFEIDDESKSAVDAAVDARVLKQMASMVKDEVANKVESAMRAAINDIVTKVIEQLKHQNTPQTNGASINKAPTFNEYRLVTQQEVSTIKSAFPGETWHECPNKHWYAVGDCGQAVVSGKCAECKAMIGRF